MTPAPAPGPLFWVVLGLVFVGLALALWSLLTAVANRRTAAGRLAQAEAYRVDVPDPAAAGSGGADGAAGDPAGSGVVALADRVYGDVSRRNRRREQLVLAGLSLAPAEWLVVRATVGLVLVALLSLVVHSALIGVPVGVVVTWIGTTAFVRWRTRRRMAAFATQLPDVLQLVASSLRSGFSLHQALDSAVKDGDQPASGEFSRALAQTRLGVDLEDALDQVAARMQSQDLAWVVMAVRISREVGGNLAEVLMTTMHTMRERVQLRRQVKALSAEGRLSAYVLVAMPIGIALWLFAVRREYISVLYTTGIGIVLLVAAVIGLAVGAWWLSRIVKVEV